jgi:hypothetical protein
MYAEKVKNGRCDKFAASLFVILFGKKVVLGLGERIKIRGSHAAPTEVPTCLNNFPTIENDAASAHLKRELPALLGLHQRKVKSKPGP